REAVEQGRLAGVGVAGQRHGGRAGATVALYLAGALDLFEILFQMTDAGAQHPAVLLELALALATAQAHAAALAREVAPLSGQPGERVLEARELHLGTGL